MKSGSIHFRLRQTHCNAEGCGNFFVEKKSVQRPALVSVRTWAIKRTASFYGCLLGLILPLSNKWASAFISFSIASQSVAVQLPPNMGASKHWVGFGLDSLLLIKVTQSSSPFNDIRMERLQIWPQRDPERGYKRIVLSCLLSHQDQIWRKSYRWRTSSQECIANFARDVEGLQNLTSVYDS